MKPKHRPAIAGKVAVVTGASSGIGQAAARAFAAAGAKVVLAARRAERLSALAAEIEAAGGQALAVPTDLTDPLQITRLVEATVARFGQIDVLADIAGWGRYNWIEALSAEELRRQYEVNVLGTAELTRQVVPHMQRRRSGHILIMSSYASRIAVPPMTIYASTKYALEGLSDGLRRELAPWGIHVSRIHPSGVPGTEFNQLAAQNGGIQFRSLPVGKVSKEHVARSLVRLVEHPRRELFLGRLYDVPVFLNRRLPGLVDVAMGLWVRRMRAAELKAPAPEAVITVDRGRPGLRPALSTVAVTLAVAALVGVVRLVVPAHRRS
jgi:short-subunit dehydrogenase